MGEHLVLEDIWKYYGNNPVLSGIWLSVEKGEFFVLVGPSGSGKTTILRIIAGFEEPTRGFIVLNGEKINGKPPNKRNLGVLFQRPALFPHMNVYENIAFGLRVRRWSEERIRARVRELLELVGLDPATYERRMPHQLSGGEQQRVALARALAPDPEIILLDEPLNFLDYMLKKKAISEFKRLHRELGKTLFYITHDQWEAMSLADRIAVIYKGVIQQVGKPREIYEKPKNLFVASFIGDNNLLEGLISDNKIYIPSLHIALENIDGYENRENRKISIAIRPENIIARKCDEENTGGRGVIRGRILEKTYLGSITMLKILVGDKEIIARHEGEDVEPGDTVCLDINEEKIIVFE